MNATGRSNYPVREKLKKTHQVKNPGAARQGEPDPNTEDPVTLCRRKARRELKTKKPKPNTEGLAALHQRKARREHSSAKQAGRVTGLAEATPKCTQPVQNPGTVVTRTPEPSTRTSATFCRRKAKTEPNSENAIRRSTEPARKTRKTLK